VADAELPADAGVARSIIPPGTAAVRDFSRLAPRIPDFVLEACVGCMSCVNACPDTAILGIALPESQAKGAVDAFAATEVDPRLATATATTHFAKTTK
jgi:pyruvate ferredoxin oxidoreductase beta subunit